MKRGVDIKRDGNGGYDFSGNIQKAILAKYGLGALLAFMMVTGVTSIVGSELWGIMMERRAVAEKLTTHDNEIADGKGRDAALVKQVEDLRLEVRQDLREIKNEVRAIGRAISQEG